VTSRVVDDRQTRFSQLDDIERVRP